MLKTALASGALRDRHEDGCSILSGSMDGSSAAAHALLCIKATGGFAPVAKQTKKTTKPRTKLSREGVYQPLLVSGDTPLDPGIHIPRGKRGSPGAKSAQGFGKVSSKTAHSEDRDGGAGPREEDVVPEQKWKNGLGYRPGGPQEPDSLSSEGSKWYMLLRKLKELLKDDAMNLRREGPDAWEREMALLSAAKDAVKEDKNWEDSGLFQLLTRASEVAVKDPKSGCTAALHGLDFAKAARHCGAIASARRPLDEASRSSPPDASTPGTNLRITVRNESPLCTFSSTKIVMQGSPGEGGNGGGNGQMRRGKGLNGGPHACPDLHDTAHTLELLAGVSRQSVGKVLGNLGIDGNVHPKIVMAQPMTGVRSNLSYHPARPMLPITPLFGRPTITSSVSAPTGVAAGAESRKVDNRSLSSPGRLTTTGDRGSGPVMFAATAARVVEEFDGQAAAAAATAANTVVEPKAEDQPCIEEESGDLPKPVSAFARVSSLVRNGSREVPEDVGPQNGDEGLKDEDRPLKKRRLTQSPSIGTVLHCMGSTELRLETRLGSDVTTVADVASRITADRPPRNSTDNTIHVDQFDLASKLWGVPLPGGPRIGATVTSGTIALNKAFLKSRNSKPEVLPCVGSGPSLHPSQRDRIATDIRLERSASAEAAGSLAHLQDAAPPLAPSPHIDEKLVRCQARDATEAPLKNAQWSGLLKHRVVTAAGVSTAVLGSLRALVPEQYLEHFPGTLYVTELRKRAEVKISAKHYVVTCELGELTSNQKDKLLALGRARLVAQCVLQHCVLTLAPFEDRKGFFRMAGFFIADDES